MKAGLKSWRMPLIVIGIGWTPFLIFGIVDTLMTLPESSMGFLFLTIFIGMGSIVLAVLFVLLRMFLRADFSSKK